MRRVVCSVNCRNRREREYSCDILIRDMTATIGAPQMFETDRQFDGYIIEYRGCPATPVARFNYRFFRSAIFSGGFHIQDVTKNVRQGAAS